MTLPCGSYSHYRGALSGELVTVTDGRISVNVKANSGDIWVPMEKGAHEAPFTNEISMSYTTAVPAAEAVAEDDWFFDSAFITNPEPEPTPATGCSDAAQNAEDNTPPDTQFFDSTAFEQGKIAGLQEAILAIMEKKGPVTEQMRKDVFGNTHHDSLVNWVKSFY